LNKSRNNNSTNNSQKKIKKPYTADVSWLKALSERYIDKFGA